MEQHEQQEQQKKKPHTSAAVKDRYNNKVYDAIRIRPKKELQLVQRIDKQIESGRATSRQAYIISAVLEKLEQDEQTEASVSAPGSSADTSGKADDPQAST